MLRAGPVVLFCVSGEGSSKFLNSIPFHSIHHTHRQETRNAIRRKLSRATAEAKAEERPRQKAEEENVSTSLRKRTKGILVLTSVTITQSTIASVLFDPPTVHMQPKSFPPPEMPP